MPMPDKLPKWQHVSFPPMPRNIMEETLFVNVPGWLRDIISCDDVRSFVRCMTEEYPCPQNGYASYAAVEKDAQKPTYCPGEVVSFIFIHRAVNCATALVEGRTGLTLNPNRPCYLGRYPLHDAASALSYDLVNLLLCHGAQVDVRTIEVFPYTRGGLLPLSVAVENFRYHRYLLVWTPKQSIFKLIIIFCLPQMKGPLEVCKLLALSTMDIVEVFNGYCMDGKILEVVALLMVAQEKLINIVSGRLSIHERIIGKVEQLINDDITLHRTSKSTRACKNRIMNLKNILLVLEVFERAGDAIGTYLQTVHSHTSKQDVVNEVKRLLVERGFLLTRKDTNMSDINCEDEDIKLATEVLESKLRPPPQHGDWLLGGASWRSVAGKVQYGKAKDWAMGGFFAKIPVLWHEQNMSRRKLLLFSPEHSDRPYFSSIRRGYFSIGWAVKKGWRYI